MFGVIIKSIALAVILGGLLRELGLKEYAKAVILSCFLTGLTAFVLWVNPYIISIKHTGQEIRKDFQKLTETLDKGSAAIDKLGKPIDKLDKSVPKEIKDSKKELDEAVEKTKIPLLDKIDKMSEDLYNKIKGE